MNTLSLFFVSFHTVDKVEWEVVLNKISHTTY
jgi:hypothetical protein